MPRKKQGPRRLDEEEQRAGNFVMGADAENNEERNRELTERLAAAPASQVDTIVQEVASERNEGAGDQAEGSLYTVPVASSQSKMYSVIFDDDDDSYQSSEDEDFNPAVEAKKKSPKKKKTLDEKKRKFHEKFPHIFPHAAKADTPPVDEELQALVEDAEVSTLNVSDSPHMYFPISGSFQFNTPVLERASSDAVWHSAIGELEVRLDLGRQGLASLELPGWGQGFQLYVTRVPGRSIVLFERFEMRKNESEVNDT